MAVQVATLDILTERAHFDPEVARAIGDAIAMEIRHSSEEVTTRAEFDTFRTNEFEVLRKEFAVFRKEFEAFRIEVRQEFVLVRAEIRVAVAESKTDMIRFMFTAMAAQTALIAGIMYFMLQHLR